MMQPLQSVRRGWCAVALLVASLSTGSLAAAEPRWAPLGPPAPPLAVKLVPHPDSGGRTYALTSAGLWSSRNGGASWTSLQRNGLDRVPTALAVDPSHPGRLFAVVQDFGVTPVLLRSDDFGGRWTELFRGGFLGTVYPHDLQVDPFAPDTLYWLVESILYRSQDGGRTWDCFQVEGDCGGAPKSAFALAPDRPQTFYVAAGYDFYATSDGGRTWSHTTIFANEPSPVDTLVATRAPRTLYAWTRSPHGRTDVMPCFVRSDDEGATWKGLLPNSATKCGTPAVDPNVPRTVRIVVATAGGAELRVSRDGGETWTPAGAAPAIGNLHIAPGGGLLLVTENGLFRSPGDQGPWRPANRGFSASQIQTLLPTKDGLLAAPVLSTVSLDPPALPLLMTEDGGRSWTGAPLRNALTLAANPTDPDHVLAAAWRFEGGWGDPLHERVLESRDGGHTWRGVVDPQIDPPRFVSLGIDASGQIFYAGTHLGGFYRSADGGRTWQASNAGLPYKPVCYHYYCQTNQVQTILPDPEKPGTVAIRFERQVYVSTNGGLNWSRRGPRPQARDGVVALARDPDGALVAIAPGTRRGDSESPGVVYRSTDDGFIWTRLGRLPRVLSLGSVAEVTSLVATRSGLFVGTNYGGVLRSADGGATWRTFNDGLPLTTVSALVADPENPGRLYATVYLNGIYAIEVP